MSNDDTVAGLRDAIRKSLELKDEVESQTIFFAKVNIRRISRTIEVLSHICFLPV